MTTSTHILFAQDGECYDRPKQESIYNSYKISIPSKHGTSTGCRQQYTSRSVMILVDSSAKNKWQFTFSFCS
jgi:hypothetical protein